MNHDGSSKYELISTLSAPSFIPNKCYSNTIHLSSLSVNLFFRIRRFLPHVSTAPFQSRMKVQFRYQACSFSDPMLISWALRNSDLSISRRHSHRFYLKERYAARASFETCFCSLVGRLVFFSFLFGRSFFKLDIVEELFIEAASDVCFFSDSRGWEVILEVWEDTW
jgi:hypothetical protein